MKKIYYSLWIGSISLLGACSSHSQDPAPTPKSQVQVRITGTDINDLGADFEYSVKPAQHQQYLHLASVVDEGTTTKSMGDWDPTTEAILLVEFAKVSHTSKAQPRASSMIKGELLINGQVKATVVLDQNTNYGSQDYPAAYTSVLIGN